MQDQVLTAWPLGRPGMAYNAEPKTDVAMRNQNPSAAQVATLTVDTATASTEYDWVLMGVAQAITAPASGETTTTVATQIKEKIANDPLTGGHVSIAQSANVLVFTYRTPGVAFTFVTTESLITLVEETTAAADADTVPFGSALMYDSGDTSDFGRARLTEDGGLTAMQYSVTPAHVNDATYTVAVKFNEIWYVRGTLADASATVDEIVDALVALLNAAFPASSVIAAPDAATATLMTLTSEVAGMPIEVQAWSDADTATVVVARTDSGGAFADIDQVFAGIAMEDQNQPGVVGTTQLSYAASKSMDVRQRGVACVQAQDAAATIGAAVWVGIGTGHEGKFRTTASGANYARCKRLRWRGTAGTYNSINQGWVEVLKAA